MSSGNIQRLRYYKGLALIAQDFQDEQAYHVEKLRRHTQRFPHGIIGGLAVVFDASKGAFVIEAGSAVDNEGREIVIPEEGLEVDIPHAQFARQETAQGLYLSIVFDESDTACAERSLCEISAKNNRTVERAEASWEDIPNPDGATITLAWVRNTDDGFDIKPTKENLDDPKENFDDNGRRIRIDSGVNTEDKIIFNPVEGHDHSGGDNGTPIPPGGIEDDAIISQKIAEADGTSGQVTDIGSGVKTDHIQDGAITGDKIRNGAVNADKLATDIAITDQQLAPDAVISSKIKEADGTSGQNTETGSGVKTEHIQNSAVTDAKIDDDAIISAKIAEADGSSGQNTDTGRGIKTNHIQDNAITGIKIGNDAVTSAKIADADGSGSQDTNAGSGIKTNHIQNDAITSAKIAEADGATGQNTESGRGVKTNHIQNNAIISTKIADNAIVSVKLAEADNNGSQDTNSGSGVKTNHIQDNAITREKIRNGAVSADKLAADIAITDQQLAPDAVISSKIREADGTTGQDTNTGSGVKTGHIQDGAVTSVKLSLIEQVQNRTVNHLSFEQVPFDFTGPDFDKPRLAQVIPTTVGATISFGLEIHRVEVERMSYIVTINNLHQTLDTQCTVRILKFN